MERDEPRHRDLSEFARPSALAPFRIRNYRFQWPADLLTSWAFEMETLILGWYVLTETGSVLWLTAFGALMFHGTLISPVLGMIGDRIGHRNLLCGMRAFYLLLAIALMALAFNGELSPLLVLVLAGLAGVVRPSDIAVRSATVAASMPAGLLIGAMGVSRTTFDMARIGGALTGAGVLANLGMGPAYAVITGCYAAGLVLTLVIGKPPIAAAPERETGGPRASPWRDLVDGLSYVWTTPRLLAAMWLAFLLNMTTLPLSGGLLAFVARGVYQTDQTGLGYLSASYALGALLGSVVMSFAGGRIRLARAMVGSAIVWSVMLLIFARTETILDGIGVLIAVGFLQSICMLAMGVMLLRTSQERFRGRVMGVRMLAIFSQTFGLMAAGVLIGQFGFGWTASLYAGLALGLTILIVLRWQAELLPRQATANAL